MTSKIIYFGAATEPELLALGTDDYFKVGDTHYEFCVEVIDGGEELRLKDCVGRMVPIHYSHFDELAQLLSGLAEVQVMKQEIADRSDMLALAASMLELPAVSVFSTL